MSKKEYVERGEMLSELRSGFFPQDVEYTEAVSIAAQIISAAPAADVVPKSEVAKEFTCFVGDPHKVDHCPYLDEIEKAKAEVAREIFEEIENKLTGEAKDILERINSITDPDAVDGLYEEVDTLKTVLAWLAELKKKYI